MRVAQLYVIWELHCYIYVTPIKAYVTLFAQRPHEGARERDVPDDKGFQRFHGINKSRERNHQKAVNAGTAAKGPHVVCKTASPTVRMHMMIAHSAVCDRSAMSVNVQRSVN